MTKKNIRKDQFLGKLPQSQIEDDVDKFKNKLNFNFGFFDNTQKAGQDFKDWDHKQLYKLLDKLKEYCKYDLEYWKRAHIGNKEGTVLTIYNSFPAKSDFTIPKNIPLDVEWGRFRLEGAVRLAGFIINSATCRNCELQPNTFYVVFLDKDHRFYLTEH